MPFDANLILLDGSIDITAALDTPPVSTVVDTNTGAKVVDLKTTSLRGLAAVLVFVDSAVANADTFTAFLEASDTLNMTTATDDVHELGKFDIAAEDKGIILGSEVPATVILRFTSKWRYIRLNATVGPSPDGFNTVYCYISPYPFYLL